MSHRHHLLTGAGLQAGFSRSQISVCVCVCALCVCPCVKEKDRVSSRCDKISPLPYTVNTPSCRRTTRRHQPHRPSLGLDSECVRCVFHVTAALISKGKTPSHKAVAVCVEQWSYSTLECCLCEGATGVKLGDLLQTKRSSQPQLSSSSSLPELQFVVGTL